MLERRFALPLIVEGLWDTLVSVSWMFDSGSSQTWHQAYLGLDRWGDSAARLAVLLAVSKIDNGEKETRVDGHFFPGIFFNKRSINISKAVDTKYKHCGILQFRCSNFWYFFHTNMRNVQTFCQ